MNADKALNSHSLKSIIQQMSAGDGTKLIAAIITSAEPLTVKAANDPALVLKEPALVCPRELKEREIEVTFALNTGSADGHSHSVTMQRGKITVHSELHTGDTVYLLALNGGRKYFVLGRG